MDAEKLARKAAGYSGDYFVARLTKEWLHKVAQGDEYELDPNLADELDAFGEDVLVAIFLRAGKTIVKACRGDEAAQTRVLASLLAERMGFEGIIITDPEAYAETKDKEWEYRHALGTPEDSPFYGGM